MSDDVFQGEDGYWRVRGQPESSYYESEAVAERVADELLGEDDGEDDVEDGEHHDDHDGGDQIPETE